MTPPTTSPLLTLATLNLAGGALAAPVSGVVLAPGAAPAPDFAAALAGLLVTPQPADVRPAVAGSGKPLPVARGKDGTLAAVLTLPADPAADAPIALPVAAKPEGEADDQTPQHSGNDDDPALDPALCWLMPVAVAPPTPTATPAAKSATAAVPQPVRPDAAPVRAMTPTLVGSELPVAANAAVSVIPAPSGDEVVATAVPPTTPAPAVPETAVTEPAAAEPRFALDRRPTPTPPAVVIPTATAPAANATPPIPVIPSATPPIVTISGVIPAVAPPAAPAAVAVASAPLPAAASSLAVPARAEMPSTAPQLVAAVQVATAPLAAALPLAAVPRPASEAVAEALAAPAPRRLAPQPLTELTGAALAQAAAPASPIAVPQTGGAQQSGIDLTRDPGIHKMIDHIEHLRDAADARDTRIRLIPDSLGPVGVSVRQDGERITVHFTADQATTRALIADAQPRLTEIAESRGVRIAQSTVDAGTGGNQPRPQPNFTAATPAAPARAEAEQDDNSDARVA